MRKCAYLELEILSLIISGRRYIKGIIPLFGGRRRLSGEWYFPANKERHGKASVSEKGAFDEGAKRPRGTP